MVIEPQLKDLGTHTVQLLCIVSDTLKLMQDVTIKIAFDKGSKNYNKIIEIKAQITTISKTGIVQIRFNQEMNVPSNVSMID